ncbi:MAG: hypothetical protein ABSF15_25940 [Candidatus Sulfotelmatobacter sp.]|jgi:hypothetical protein
MAQSHKLIFRSACEVSFEVLNAYHRWDRGKCGGKPQQSLCQTQFGRQIGFSRMAVAGARLRKTAAAIHKEVAREVNQLLGRIFAQRRKDGRTDLETVESAL